MVDVYREEDGDLNRLDGAPVSVLGYGNQGEAWAQNLRDSGVNVVVGSVRDSSYDRALAAGFDVRDTPSATRAARIHCLLVPDEVMPSYFDEQVKPSLDQGDTLVIASGYNAYYALLDVPADVDLVMIAPRMIGTGVRNGYVDGSGFPSLVSVEQNFTGEAHETMLAVGKALGTLRRGAFASSAFEETLCDLFNEHFGYVYALRRGYELLIEAGASPEAAMLEFWASGEEMEIARVHMTHGLFHQLNLHSRTSQYGQEVTAVLGEADETAERERLRRVIARIVDGTFAREWKQEQDEGCVNWKRVREDNMSHPMIAEETRLLSILGVLEREAEREPTGNAAD